MTDLRGPDPVAALVQPTVPRRVAGRAALHGSRQRLGAVMGHVEITFRNGVTITADVSEWTTREHGRTGEVVGYRWVNDGPRKLQRLNVDEVIAVVFVDGNES